MGAFAVRSTALNPIRIYYWISRTEHKCTYVDCTRMTQVIQINNGVHLGLALNLWTH